ncbi:MAG: CHASE3 domain-containing protein [Planctomycetota bacterium]
MLRISNTGVFIVFASVAALIVASALLGFAAAGRHARYAESARHAYQVLESIDGLRSAIKDAERGHQGFLITGDVSYLTPYEEGVAGVESSRQALWALADGTPEQDVRLERLAEALTRKMTVMRDTLEVRREKGFEAARDLVLDDDGKDSMNVITALLDEQLTLETKKLDATTARAERDFGRASAVAIAAVFATLIAFVAAVAMTRRNIVARASAVRELAAQSAFLRATLESIVEGLVVTDASGRISYLNAVAEQMAGYQLSDVGGRSASEVLDVRDARTGRPAELLLSRVLRDGGLHKSTKDRVLVRRDGQSRAIDESASPLRDADGVTIGAVLAIRDVTEQRENERRVRELLAAERETALRMRAIADAVRAFGSARSRDDVVEALRRETLRILAASEVSVSFDATGANDGGVAAPLTGAEGRAIGAVRASFDTLDEEQRARDAAILNQLAQAASASLENVRLYDELRDGDRRKDEFLATLAHELRNPLAPMRNASLILRSKNADADDRARALASVERQLDLLVRLVDDLLDVSRITRGKIELKREHVELADVIGRALEISRPVVAASGHALSVQLPPERVRVHADPVRLAQVLANLLNNAAKYTERSGHIWLSCTAEDDEVVISVRDDGMGIPAEMLDHIFDMFWQHEVALERAQGGLGVGLTLVRQLVDLHGGRIEAKSAGVGFGSEFVVYLPRGKDPSPVRDTGRAQPGARRDAASRTRRVLVVDDNQDSADSLAILLRLRGHDVRTAYDGESALDTEREFRPAILFLDIGLPRKNGYDVAGELRALRGRDVTIVAMTGFGQLEDRQRSLEAGFDHHLVKPVDPSALAAVFDAS